MNRPPQHLSNKTFPNRKSVPMAKYLLRAMNADWKNRQIAKKNFRVEKKKLCVVMSKN